MTGRPDGRFNARIKRKPPPAFPYSPKYPLPDPSDPFAPLQVLRERAHSSHTQALSNPSNVSLVPSLPSTGDSSHLYSELPALPRAAIHSSRSIEVFEQFRDGYHSDISRPPRPPRARTRPARDSKSYFSDADTSSSLPPSQRHQDQDQNPSERQTERQYHYRRRSQTLSFFPPTLPQPPAPVHEPDRLAAQERAVEGLDDATHLSHSQYVYDDRQSHGHVYGSVHGPHHTSTVDSHRHSHLQLSVHSGPVTPPMTSDDTLTERSESVLSDVPPPPPKHITIESDVGHSSLEARGRIERELSAIRTSDFPALLGKSEPESPPPVPVPPPRPRYTSSDSEPEHDYTSRRRITAFGTRERKDSLTTRMRRVSLLARGRKASDPSPPTRTRGLPTVRDSVFGSSSHISGQSSATETARNSFVPEVLRAPGASGDPVENKKKVKMTHRKSLSHVSLGVTPLPTLTFGPTSSPGLPAENENVSMASTLVAYPDGDEFGGPAPTYPEERPRELDLVQPRPQSYTQSQALAQTLELTPLPLKDTPLPPIRKDTRLPTPPYEGSRSSRVPAPVSGSEYDWRRDTQPARTHETTIEDAVPVVVTQTAVSRPLTSIITSGHTSEMEMDEVVLMRPSRFGASSDSEQEQSSPSPPLLANSLLVRPTSAATAISMPPPPPSAPFVTPAPISSQINVPTISVSHPSARPDIGTRRGSTPPPPPRRGPSPPAPRRVPSPLPPPPRDEFGPPTPAPLPRSPPSRMDADLPTPLPQPPLRPPPAPAPAPRTRSPVHQSERSEQFLSAPTPEPVRPHSPAQSRPRKSEERRSSDDRQERSAPSTSYLPAVQTRPPQSAQAESQQVLTPGNRSRTKAPQTTNPTSPYNSLRQRRPGQSQANAQSSGAHTQLPFRPQPPSTHQHAPSRAQSPQPVTVVRTQPSTSTPARAQSPHPVVMTSRAQSPPPFRAQSPAIQASMPASQSQQAQSLSNLSASRPPPPPPPPSSYTQHSHGHMQSRSFPSQPSSVDHVPEHERDRERDNDTSATTHGHYHKSVNANGAMSTVTGTPSSPPNQAPYAVSVESTPAPLPNTPSTTFSYPYRAPGNASRRGHDSRDAISDTAVDKSKPRARTPNGMRRQHRSAEEPSAMAFDEHAGLTKDQIQRVSSFTVVAQNGLRMPFGELFRDSKTIVIFIRHFWCAMCQDYMYSIARNVDFDALKRAGIELVVIGNGSPGMIRSYRSIFRMPINIYTDPTLRLHAALGMTLRTSDPGPDSEKGEYVRHGPIGGLAMVVRNAICVGMPVWEKGGDATQLGGEFVIGPGFNCSYAHRMTTTRSHAPIREVLRAAGYHRALSAVGTKPEGHSLSPDEEDLWMEERRRSLARMQVKREKRRGFETQATSLPELYEPELGYGSDTGSGSVSANGSWTSNVDKEVQTVQRRERPSRERTGPQRRGTKRLQVANPDDSRHDLHEHEHRDRHEHRKHLGNGRVHVARHDTGPDEWAGATPALTYINQYGRRDDGYEPEDGNLAYNYRHD